MDNLSIVIITKNEAKNIAKCLDSIQDLSDDIIVVDSGSTDNTKDICNNYNLSFVENPFLDYSSQKNFGANLAKNDFILSIDADECISSQLKASIKELQFSKNKNIAYNFNRLNHHCGKPVKFGGWYPDKKLRIWNKNFGQWEGTIHENIILKKGSKITHLDGDLLHYTYHTKLEHTKQAKKFAKLNAESDLKKGKSTNKLLAITSMIFRFISVYILRLGIFDGNIGFFIAKTTARATFWRKIELLQLKKSIKL